MTLVAAPAQAIKRYTVGVGDLATARGPQVELTTHALGSCIAICLWDPATRVGGLLHFLLAESKTNPERARVQPATFADTGAPLLVQQVRQLGAGRQLTARLVGGAEVLAGSSDTFAVGKRNVLAARQAMWRAGIPVVKECVGGSVPRTLYLNLTTGLIVATYGKEVLCEL